MPGISDSPPSQLQGLNTVNAVNSRPDVDISSIGAVPSFDVFMDAYRKGVISADDIRHRAIVGNTGNEAEKAGNLANQAVANQVTLDANDIRPKQRELESQRLEGATQEQTLLNQINHPDAAVRYKAREEFANRQLEAQATAYYGTPQPTLYKSTDRKPEDFNTWVARQANSFQGTDAQRADFVNHLQSRGEKGEEYSAYKDAIKNEKVPVPKGTPEYKDLLREKVNIGLSHQKLAEINFDVLKEAGIARAKAEAEAPNIKTKQQQTTQENVLQELHRSDALKRFTPQQEAFNKVEEIKRNGVYNNATDVSLIYNYVKLLDPASAVREGEVHITENTVPAVKHIWNQFQGIFTDHNKTLDDNSRKNFINEMEKLRAGAEATVKPELERIKAVAESNGIPINQVLTKPQLDILQRSPAAANRAAQASPAELSGAQVYPSLSAVPSNVRVYKGTDGQFRVNPNYKP